MRWISSLSQYWDGNWIDKTFYLLIVIIVLLFFFLVYQLIKYIFHQHSNYITKGTIIKKRIDDQYYYLPMNTGNNTITMLPFPNGDYDYFITIKNDDKIYEHKVSSTIFEKNDIGHYIDLEGLL